MQGRRWRQLIPWVLAMTWPGLVSCYNGVLIGSLSTLDPDVAGDVYAWDERRLLLKNFTFNGDELNAHFLVGVSGIHESGPCSTGRIIAMPDGSMDPLGFFSNSDIVLQLPGVLVTDLTWFAVYSINAKRNFGHVDFPQNPVISPPAPKMIGEFEQRAHDVRSGDIFVQDTNTFHIKNLHYDGTGPAAFFLVGRGSVISATDATKVPDERGSLDVLRGYSGQDITIRLPENLTMSDIDWLAIYCTKFSINFGEVFVPVTLNVPPATLENQDDGLSHCEELTDQLQISWEIDDPFITLELSGYIDEGQYMAFGLSGATDRSAMLNADVFSVCIPVNGTIKVTDYFISSYAQCTGSSNPGVCSDTIRGGNDDLEVLETSAFDGVVRAMFKRRLDTADSSTDIAFQLNSPMYVVWAKGDLNEFGKVTKHSERLTGDMAIHFGRTDTGDCTPLVEQIPPELPTWEPHHISGVTVFEARIGPAGLWQGYEALTGITSWGIVWYINGVIIPELTVVRNKTYTFRVEGGGAGPTGSDVALHHPFYITDDPKGGYYQQSAEERQRHRVYAGIENGMPTSNAVGRYCEYKTTQSPPKNGYPTFEDFANTLRLQCDAGEPGILTWTPDKNTPDLVYYQCYTHYRFGWKIHVTNEPTGSARATAGVTLVVVTLVITALKGF